MSALFLCPASHPIFPFPGFIASPQLQTPAFCTSPLELIQAFPFPFLSPQQASCKALKNTMLLTPFRKEQSEFLRVQW